MAGGAESTSSAKRAKLRKKKKRDALERKKNDLFLRIEKAKELVREAEEYLAKHMPIVCDDLEDENRDELMGQLPLELWEKIVKENLEQNDLLSFAMTCRFFRDTTKDIWKKLKTNLNVYVLLDQHEHGEMTPHTLGWFRWVCDTFEILPGYKWRGERVKGAVYEGDLVNCAALQSSVEILRWLMEEKGCELNDHTFPSLVGQGGSVEVLKYLKMKGYDLNELKEGSHDDNEGACEGAARGGHLEALKFLRGQDPPCPWDERACDWAVRGGHLEVLKWLRSQDPPCPWNRGECREEASYQGHQHIVKWIDQQEDGSDL